MLLLKDEKESWNSKATLIKLTVKLSETTKSERNNLSA